ncbi:cystathionine gamma-lyase [Henriciella pelagia]|jgi:cystathionine gamma-lyase|uniref:Cystathionine gamma-lyase n=1 Tax=Henriciella pelagia TaxID=1977912 RepID=A0ABQ1JP63_9PROT|nr:cystathionine gamma-lyase [Henriciella pelagia]GGB71201.1 cystathionine gamma-lyase [Henriciella pelagia]
MSIDDASTNARIMAMLHKRASSIGKGESLTPPIVNAAKYALPGDPDHPFPYGRFDNPGWGTVESAIGALEDAETICFPSGMAAVTAALMATLKPKSKLLLPSDGYYTVRVLLNEFIRQHEIETVEIPTADMTGHALDRFDLVWIETPSNPGLDVCDIAAITKRAHAAGALVIVDNTTATPLLQRPLDLGADLTVSSDTKALAGHSDVLFGHVSGRDAEIMARIRNWRKLAGSTPGPAEAYLAYRGLMTLELRLARMCANAQALANLFYSHKAVEAVRFPGLADDPSYRIAAAQMAQPGFVIGVTFADAATAERFITDCPAIFAATSFGGIQTSAERRARWGDAVREGYVRLSAGCEPTAALVKAISDTLDAL